MNTSIIRFADDKGYLDLNTKTALIMRDGVYTYLAGEFPNLTAGDPFRKLRVYRSPESVRAAYERFKALGKLPVIFNHPDKDLDIKDFKQGYGYDPELVEEGAHLAIKCKLHLDDESLEAYKDGIREISCGWSGDFKEPGEADKSIYDYEQTFEDFNHIALVSEGRCGNLCSIKDKKPSQESLQGLIGVGEKGAKKMAKDKKALFSDACKYVDELEKMAEKVKTSNEIEDSHAEGLLNAVKGLKDAIKGFEEFAAVENEEEPEEPKASADGAEGQEPVTDEEPKEPEAEETEKEETVKTVEVSEKDEEGEEGEEVKDADAEEPADEKDEKEDDKAKMLREADAVAMLPVSKFKGGEEEKFRTLTAILERLGYAKNPAERVNDAAFSQRITDAKNEGMKIAVQRFHDVLPYIADGTIPFADVKPGMTPCEIKQKFVEERTGIRYNDAKELGVAFTLVAKQAVADTWAVRDAKVAQSVLDEKMAEVANIGLKKKGDK